jgi:uncharacterized short protein YbdD (DUF466 family)
MKRSPESGVQSPETRAQRVLATIKRIAGMPDYETHVRHLRECHPERAVPTPGEFYDDYLRYRYESGPTRCC